MQGIELQSPRFVGLFVVFLSLCLSHYSFLPHDLPHHDDLLTALHLQDLQDIHDHFEWTTLIKVAAQKDFGHVKEAVKHLLIYQRLANTSYYAHKGDNSPPPQNEQRLLDILHGRLMPWSKMHWNELVHFNMKRTGRGIAIYSCPQCTYSTLFAIESIRKSGCKLPIEVFYAWSPVTLKETPQSPEYRADFAQFVSHYLEQRSIKDVTLRNFEDQMELNYVHEGVIRSYIILSSSFEELIYMDASVVFLQNPETIFQESTWKTTSTFFFRDRSFGSNNQPLQKWLREIFAKSMNVPTRGVVEKSRVWNGMSSHELAPQVIALNVKEKFYGILLSCTLSAEPIRNRLLEKYLLGDKDTLWISLAIFGEMFGFSNWTCGCIGTRSVAGDDRTGQVCSPRIMQRNSNGILFFTDGISSESNSLTAPAAELLHWQAEPTVGKEPWHMDHNGVCLVQGLVTEIQGAEKNTLEGLGSLWSVVAGTCKDVLRTLLSNNMLH
jgi:hypothetical protein